MSSGEAAVAVVGVGVAGSPRGGQAAAGASTAARSTDTAAVIDGTAAGSPSRSPSAPTHGSPRGPNPRHKATASTGGRHRALSPQGRSPANDGRSPSPLVTGAGAGSDAPGVRHKSASPATSRVQGSHDGSGAMPMRDSAAAVPEWSGDKHKYVVLRGNYSQLVREAFHRRNWWEEAVPLSNGIAAAGPRRATGARSGNASGDGSDDGSGDGSDEDGGDGAGDEEAGAGAASAGARRPPVPSQSRLHDIPSDFNFLWRPGNFVSCFHDAWNQGSQAQQVNHFEFIRPLCTKHGLNQSLVAYYAALNVQPWRFIPPTYVLESGNLYSADMVQFKRRFSEIGKGHKQQCLAPKHCAQNVWMVKPVASNQGRGIELYSALSNILAHVQAKGPTSNKWVVQKYIERPMLIHRRKFDIRVWALVTPSLDLYLYREGYLRTSSEEYTFDLSKSFVHLTNHCLQKHSPDLGKYEEGNTLNFEQFQAYLDEHVPSAQVNFRKHLWPRIKECIVDSFLAVKTAINARERKHCFELFGYDFLVDEDLRVWLLEVNTNPYLGAQNSWHAALLPAMVDDMLKLVCDPLFPRPSGACHQQAAFQHAKQKAAKEPDENWFDLILPNTVEPINVCTSVASLYGPGVLAKLPTVPRPRRGRGKRGGAVDVNPYRNVNVYVPPEDYVRPSLEHDAGQAKRSAPPTLPSAFSPSRPRRGLLRPSLYPTPSAKPGDSDSDDDSKAPLDLSRHTQVLNQQARARARARARAVAAEVAAKKKAAEAEEAARVAAAAAAEGGGDSGSPVLGEGLGAGPRLQRGLTGHARSGSGGGSRDGSDDGSAGGGGGAAAGSGAPRGAGARYASSLVSMVNEVRRNQASAALTHSRATALRAVLAAALPRQARGKSKGRAASAGSGSGHGLWGSTAPAEGGGDTPTARRVLTDEERKQRDDSTRERLTYALYVLLLLSCKEVCRVRIVGERLVPLVVAIARGRSRHARDGLLKLTAVRILANLCTSLASRGQLIKDGVVPALVAAAMEVHTRQPLYAQAPDDLLPWDEDKAGAATPAAPTPTSALDSGSAAESGDGGLAADATAGDAAQAGLPPASLLAVELGVRMTNDMIAFKNAMPVPLAAVRAIGSLLRPCSNASAGASTSTGALAVGVVPLHAYNRRGHGAGSFPSLHSGRRLRGGFQGSAGWRQAMVDDGAMDVLLLLAGQAVTLQHSTDIGVPPMPPRSRPGSDDASPRKFRPPPIPIKASGFNPYNAQGGIVDVPAQCEGEQVAPPLYSVLRATKLEATQALQLFSTAELLNRQAQAPESFDCVSLAQRNAQLCVLSTLGHELDTRKRLTLQLGRASRGIMAPRQHQSTSSAWALANHATPDATSDAGSAAGSSTAASDTQGTLQEGRQPSDTSSTTGGTVGSGGATSGTGRRRDRIRGSSRQGKRGVTRRSRKVPDMQRQQLYHPLMAAPSVPSADLAASHPSPVAADHSGHSGEAADGGGGSDSQLPRGGVNSLGHSMELHSRAPARRLARPTAVDVGANAPPVSPKHGRRRVDGRSGHSTTPPRRAGWRRGGSAADGASGGDATGARTGGSGGGDGVSRTAAVQPGSEPFEDALGAFDGLAAKQRGAKGHTVRHRSITRHIEGGGGQLARGLSASVVPGSGGLGRNGGGGDGTLIASAPAPATVVDPAMGGRRRAPASGLTASGGVEYIDLTGTRLRGNNPGDALATATAATAGDATGDHRASTSPRRVRTARHVSSPRVRVDAALANGTYSQAKMMPLHSPLKTAATASIQGSTSGPATSVSPANDAKARDTDAPTKGPSIVVAAPFATGRDGARRDTARRRGVDATHARTGARGRQDGTPRSVRQGRHAGSLHSTTAVVGASPLLSSSPTKPVATATRPRTSQSPLRGSQRPLQRVVRRASSHLPRQASPASGSADKVSGVGTRTLSPSQPTGARQLRLSAQGKHPRHAPGRGLGERVQVAFEGNDGGSARAVLAE